MDQEAQRVLTPGPMITFPGARKLSSFLVRAKLYPLERTVACKINRQFNCSKKTVVYLLTCNKCFKEYVWQTVDEFRRRWTINLMIGNSKALKFAYRNNFSVIFQWQATVDF